MHEMLKRLLDARNQTVAEGRTVINEAEVAKRDLTTEENEKIDRALAAAGELDVRIAAVRKTVEGDKAADEARALLPGDPTPKPSGDPTPRGEDATEKAIRSFLAGESRSLMVTPDKPMTMAERRDLSKLTAAAGANTVQTSFYGRLMAHLIEVSGIMAAGPTVLTTTTGEKIQVPKTTAHSAAALVAEAGLIAESDPVFGQVDLDAFKYGTLIQVSNELVTDTSVDLLGYLAMQCGRAVGNAFGVHAITGTGVNQPNGAITASTLGITGGAGVTGKFTADNLIDLFYSVIAPYRNSPSAGWLMRDASVGEARKLKGSDNNYLWQPGLTAEAPDMLLGKKVNTDPNVAGVGLGAKSVAFGDFSQYFVREVAGVRFERSDEFAFNQDLITFRCVWRADGDLVDTTGAIKHFAGNAA